MNILRHKSWHVRTKKNIARVRKDEENARKEEEAKQWRADHAEKSARIEFLRDKSGECSRYEQKKCYKFNESKLKFELFQDFKDKTTNDCEKDNEERVEQEKWEVKAGIFSYLDGRYKHEKNDEDQWYTKSIDERRLIPEKDSNCKDDKTKRRLDPLEKIKYYCKEIEKNQTKKNNRNETAFKSFLSSKSSSTSIERDEIPKNDIIMEDLISLNTQKISVESDNEGRSKRKRKRSHSKKSKKHVQSDNSDSEEDISINKSLIDKLRKERLERERKAQEQTRIALNLPNSSVRSSDFRKYNSQYNPHLHNLPEFFEIFLSRTWKIFQKFVFKTNLKNCQKNCEKMEAIFDFICLQNNVFFKNQQKDEPKLDRKEKKNILRELFKSNPSTFLYRYRKYLTKEHFEIIKNKINNDQIALEMIEQCLKEKNLKKNDIFVVKNRRMTMVEKLLKDGKYFSLYEMQVRHPYLFEKYIGSYMNIKEKQDFNKNCNAQNYVKTNWSSYLLEQIRQGEIRQRFAVEKKLEGGNDEKEEKKDEIITSYEDTQNDSNVNKNDREKEHLKNEFMFLMIQNFIDGKDSEFYDYSQVDNSDKFDISKEYERDLEDKYFEDD